MAATIWNDAKYQAGLHRLSHWLNAAESVKTIDQLVAFVHGLHATTQTLDSVTATMRSSGAITYPEYDVKKNAAVARMRFQMGLDVLASIVVEAAGGGGGGTKAASFRGSQQQSQLLLEELKEDVLPNVAHLRETAVREVLAFLPDLESRNDPHLDAFHEFLDKYHRTPTSRSTRSQRKAQQKLQRGAFTAESAKEERTQKKTRKARKRGVSKSKRPSQSTTTDA